MVVIVVQDARTLCSNKAVGVIGVVVMKKKYLLYVHYLTDTTNHPIKINLPTTFRSYLVSGFTKIVMQQVIVEATVRTKT
jgi:hypothetical protein